jgi:hypothetical protein
MPFNSLSRRILLAAVPGVALGICALFLVDATRAQQVSGMEAMDFKVQLENQKPPNESQIKTLLEGTKAEPLSDGKILLTEAKLKSFGTNGVLEMIARSPSCVFDSVQRTISSTGALQVQNGDGRFTLDGEGFWLQQTNAHLIVSNRVHTVIINAPGKTRKP